MLYKCTEEWETETEREREWLRLGHRNIATRVRARVCVRLRCKLASEIKCGRALKVDRRFIVRKTRYILPSAPWHTVCSIKSYLHTPVFILYNIHLQCFACPLQRVTYGEACMWLWRRAAKLEGGLLCDRYNNNNNNITRRASYSLNTIPPTYTHTLNRFAR